MLINYGRDVILKFQSLTIFIPKNLFSLSTFFSSSFPISSDRKCSTSILMLAEPLYLMPFSAASLRSWSWNRAHRHREMGMAEHTTLKPIMKIEKYAAQPEKVGLLLKLLSTWRTRKRNEVEFISI